MLSQCGAILKCLLTYKKKNGPSATLQQTHPRRLRWQAAGQAGGKPGRVILVVAIAFLHGL